VRRKHVNKKGKRVGAIPPRWRGKKIMHAEIPSIEGKYREMREGGRVQRRREGLVPFNRLNHHRQEKEGEAT